MIRVVQRLSSMSIALLCVFIASLVAQVPLVRYWPDITKPGTFNYALVALHVSVLSSLGVCTVIYWYCSYIFCNLEQSKAKKTRMNETSNRSIMNKSGQTGKLSMNQKPDSNTLNATGIVLSQKKSKKHKEITL